jgi:hypothetical protein
MAACLPRQSGSLPRSCSHQGHAVKEGPASPLCCSRPRGRRACGFRAACWRRSRCGRTRRTTPPGRAYQSRSLRSGCRWVLAAAGHSTALPRLMQAAGTSSCFVAVMRHESRQSRAHTHPGAGWLAGAEAGCAPQPQGVPRLLWELGHGAPATSQAALGLLLEAGRTAAPGGPLATALTALQVLYLVPGARCICCACVLSPCWQVVAAAPRCENATR